MNFQERTSCIFCKGSELSSIFKENLEVPIGNNVVDHQRDLFPYMPYNVQQCNSCLSFQIKYVGDLHILYENAVAGAHGSIRSTHNTLFASFICENKNIDSICEIGAGNGQLSDIVVEQKKINYTIIDPSYGGNQKDRHILSQFFEDCKGDDILSNTIIMSHVFEHFYNPVEILNKIKEISHVEYIYLSFPDLERFLEDGTYLVLTAEHTFYVDTKFLIDLFDFHGFSIQRSYSHENHSIFFEFKRTQTTPLKVFPKNSPDISHRVKAFFSKLQKNIEVVNKRINTSLKTYIWPCSMHTIFALAFGLQKQTIHCVLDNSPLKIGKYLFGHNIECDSFQEITQSAEKKNIVLVGGCYNKEIIQELKISNENNIYYI